MGGLNMYIVKYLPPLSAQVNIVTVLCGVHVLSINVKPDIIELTYMST